jgi:hypothetical protein
MSGPATAPTIKVRIEIQLSTAPTITPIFFLVIVILRRLYIIDMRLVLVG